MEAEEDDGYESEEAEKKAAAMEARFARNGSPTKPLARAPAPSPAPVILPHRRGARVPLMRPLVSYS